MHKINENIEQHSESYIMNSLSKLNICKNYILLTDPIEYEDCTVINVIKYIKYIYIA